VRLLLRLRLPAACRPAACAGINGLWTPLTGTFWHDLRAKAVRDALQGASTPRADIMAGLVWDSGPSSIPQLLNCVRGALLAALGGHEVRAAASGRGCWPRGAPAAKREGEGERCAVRAGSPGSAPGSGGATPGSE
jgi:hypothetical protein